MFHSARTARPQVGHFRSPAGSWKDGGESVPAWRGLDLNSAVRPPPAIKATINNGTPITIKPISAMNNIPAPIIILAPLRSGDCAPVQLPTQRTWLPTAPADRL